MPATSVMPAALRGAVEAELADARGARTTSDARRLSDRYLADRPADRPIVASPDDAAAYVTARMPATFAAVAFALAQVRDAVPHLAPRSLLDLGSGSGAATWAAWDVFGSLERADLLDYSRPMLAAAERMLAHADLAVTTTLADASATHPTAASPSDPTHDLAVAAFVLSEITTAQRTAVVERLTAAASGAIVVVEPGTPAGFRRVLAVRDQLLAAGWRVVAPCPHSGACPLAGDDADWCHAAVRLERSRAHRQAKAGERSFEDEKLAYVAAVPPDSPDAADLPAARVLRHPQTHPGHIRLELCTAAGEHERAVVTKRDKEAFRAARKVEWGQAWRTGPRA
ncbi:small ribosomal subunit Rsm22 family protein [Litorihabitans aurantiacus]|uniref:rRNA methyltransferase n=1 Tax=Litorihabitans aurantiacus TaxID=1930061 RepID=A0AA37XGC9_9MICO|nr:small ribosomal subunit Rsm22 family protein [Litorihabitans aurantiacus]GMA32732.1 rRNA methyltransferase [Litorihabitans aurantiacus]